MSLQKFEIHPFLINKKRKTFNESFKLLSNKDIYYIPKVDKMPVQCTLFKNTKRINF